MSKEAEEKRRKLEAPEGAVKERTEIDADAAGQADAGAAGQADVDAAGQADAGVAEQANVNVAGQADADAAEDGGLAAGNDSAEDSSRMAEDKIVIQDVNVQEIEERSTLRTLGEDDPEEDDEEDETPRKRTVGDYIRYLVMFAALCILVYSVFSLVTIFMEYRAGEKEYDDLEAYVTPTEDPDTETIVEYEDEEYPLNPDFEIPNIDWDSLLAINPEVCGWIQFETIEEINYPIAQHSDNAYYLTHTIYGTENSSGSIFIEAQNASDFSDMNTIVYGHNMKNGSMFGLLRYYKEESYYSGNEYFWIYTPQANYRYKIFTCYEPSSDSDIYTWWSDPCDEYTTYLTNVQSYSKYSTGVTVHPTDRIVTLSTCTSRGHSYRFVVQAKLVYSEIKQSSGESSSESSD